MLLQVLSTYTPLLQNPLSVRSLFGPSSLWEGRNAMQSYCLDLSSFHVYIHSMLDTKRKICKKIQLPTKN